MKNKGLIGLHGKAPVTDASPPRPHNLHANTAYGQVDLKGWSGLTRINSIEDNFGGGEDPGNKAMRNSILKAHNRPTSANLHNLRSVKKDKLINNQAAIYTETTYMLEKQSKLFNRSQNSRVNKTISTAAATHPMYNAAMMSSQMKNYGRI